MSSDADLAADPGPLEDPAYGPGVVDVGGLTIAYDSRVLEPRPWTAMQSRWAAELLADIDTEQPDEPGEPGPPLLELCSGAGHIGLLAATLADCRWVAVDLDPTACGYTTRNAETAGVGDRVEVRQGRLEESLGDDERFAVVVADPPWVRHESIGEFPEDPVLAIDGGDDGLHVARAVLRACAGHLRPDGSLLLQLGHTGQVDQLAADLTTRGWTVEETRTRERGVVVRLTQLSE
ncbi:RsmD family RNA methyltransferase [Nocardioidaceae bacterium]|nr:RsmD family RNA methyltransferase [Nocardioidaceae bacterium]